MVRVIGQERLVSLPKDSGSSSFLTSALSCPQSPTESCDVLGDIQTCIKKSMEQNPRRSRSRAKGTSLLLGQAGQPGYLCPAQPKSAFLLVASQEPVWVDVMVEILLSLLAQPSNLMRQVVRNVFSHICPHLTPRGLQLILAVSWGLWRNKIVKWVH